MQFFLGFTVFHQQGGIVNGSDFCYLRCSVRLHRRNRRRLRRSRLEESTECRDALSLCGWGPIPNVTRLCANRRCLDAIEVAFLACHNRRVALRHWDGPFFWQSIPYEREWNEVVGYNHATGRIILFGGLGLFSVGCVESLTIIQSGASNTGEIYG